MWLGGVSASSGGHVASPASTASHRFNFPFQLELVFVKLAFFFSSPFLLVVVFTDVRTQSAAKPAVQ